MVCLLLLLMMLTACAAGPQDLSAQMLTFPQETNTTNVRLTSSIQRMSAVTVCLRFITDLSRSHSLFSLATPNASNGFQLRKDPSNGMIDVFVNDNIVRFRGLNYLLNTWHSICSTWDEDSGLVQLWFDGMSTVRRFIGGSIIAHPLIILGQDQDSHGGDFDIRQSFVGMLSDVHMWDYTLSSCEIHNYMEDLNFTPGNALNWRALDVEASEGVLVEDRQMTC